LRSSKASASNCYKETLAETRASSDRIFNFAWSHDGKQIALAHVTVTNDVVVTSNFKDAMKLKSYQQLDKLFHLVAMIIG